MKKYLLAVPTLALLLTPLIASAHEHAVYKIGDKYYQIVIGSMNEPVAIDDKTGVEIMVSQCVNASCSPTRGPDGDMDGPVGPAVGGLESTLKVELQAGSKKKSLDFTPKWSELGSYYAPFYPTVATTYAYRLLGTINSAPFDATFTCLLEGASHDRSDMTEKKLNDSVTRIMDGGGFGCPNEKAPLGFPESASSLVDVRQSGVEGGRLAQIALALSSVAIGLGLYRRNR